MEDDHPGMEGHRSVKEEDLKTRKYKIVKEKDTRDGPGNPLRRCWSPPQGITTSDREILEY